MRNVNVSNDIMHNDFHYRCQLLLKPSVLWQRESEQPGDRKMTVCLRKAGSGINTSDEQSEGARSGFLFALNLNNFSVDE